jgi:selenocysteine lyase/cysteine desulfurase
MTERQPLFHAFASDFFGLRHEDPVKRGGESSIQRRVYLDSAATTLMSRPVWDGLTEYLKAACANSHTDAHRAGRDTTVALEASRDAVGRLVGYRPNEDVVLFTSNGATGAINFLARALFPPRLRTIIRDFSEPAPEGLLSSLRQTLPAEKQDLIDALQSRPLVVTTRMEHHSNLLPWIEAVGRHNLRVIDVDPTTGTLNMAQLRDVLAKEGDRVRLVAVTGLSNVTGIENPVREIAALAHRAGADIMVDGAQWVPHAKVDIHAGSPEERIDFLVLSGHKLYAPGSRGALVGNLSFLDKAVCVTDVGGGMVDFVTIEDYQLKNDVTAREEAGTPNIPGSIAMGLVAEMLMRVGMDEVAAEEKRLTRKLLDVLDAIDDVEVYGSTDLDAVPRGGVVAFNVKGMHYQVVASYLNDAFNVAVRDGCFCAHPYLAALLELGEVSSPDQWMRYSDRPGMVRASMGIYTTDADIEALDEALRDLVGRKDEIKEKYQISADGKRYRREDPHPAVFELGAVVDQWAQAAKDA